MVVPCGSSISYSLVSVPYAVIVISVLYWKWFHVVVDCVIAFELIGSGFRFSSVDT